MHLQEVMAGASHLRFEEVEFDAATPTGGDWKGEEKTCRRQMVCFDALTCRAGVHVLHCGRQTRATLPPHRAPGEGERLVATEVPQRGVAWSSCNTVSRSEPAARMHKRSSRLARAPTVQEPVMQDKGTMRTGGRGRRGRVVEQGGHQRAKNGVGWQGGAGGCC